MLKITDQIRRWFGKVNRKRTETTEPVLAPCSPWWEDCYSLPGWRGSKSSKPTNTGSRADSR